MRLRKSEYISKYGQEAYDQWLSKNRVKKSSYYKQWYDENKSSVTEYKKQYYQEHKDKYHESVITAKKKYLQTKNGRADRLIQNYKTSDKKYNRGPCTLTREWVVDHIFASSCIYCGETDWKKLGCDRIDNSKPHTPDNCVCACSTCNKKRGVKDYQEFRSSIS